MIYVRPFSEAARRIPNPTESKLQGSGGTYVDQNKVESRAIGESCCTIPSLNRS